MRKKTKKCGAAVAAASVFPSLLFFFSLSFSPLHSLFICNVFTLLFFLYFILFLSFSLLFSLFFSFSSTFSFSSFLHFFLVFQTFSIGLLQWKIGKKRKRKRQSKLHLLSFSPYFFLFPSLFLSFSFSSLLLSLYFSCIFFRFPFSLHFSLVISFFPRLFLFLFALSNFFLCLPPFSLLTVPSPSQFLQSQIVLNTQTLLLLLFQCCFTSCG